MTTRILPVLSLMLAALIIFGYINPIWAGTIAPLSAAITGNDQALAAAEAYMAKENQLASARDAIPSEDLARLLTLLPDSVDNVSLILDLNALAARSGLVLSNIDVMSGASSAAGQQAVSAAAQPVGSIDLTLSASGTWNAFRAFLSGIEHSARLLDVVDLSVKGSDTGIYAYTLSIRLYWLR